ncbi:hypothetical protein UlMin_013046 [Ulmus minor]
MEQTNEKVVRSLYEAFSSNDIKRVCRFFSPYLDWWFHGPPSHQYLKRLLTGSSSPNDSSFLFVPLSLVAFESTVIVEGYDKERLVSWVHAWTVTEGIITQVREYYNTSVTVTRFGNPNGASSEITTQSDKCQSLWESKLCSDNSVPGLVLAL